MTVTTRHLYASPARLQCLWQRVLRQDVRHVVGDDEEAVGHRGPVSPVGVEDLLSSHRERVCRERVAVRVADTVQPPQHVRLHPAEETRFNKIAVVALRFSRSLYIFRLTFLRMRDKCKLRNVQRNDKAFVA